ncbi:hypothetical protein DFH09DRAFT_1089036 [Mycena vulgaris]|nr:hypothetical protein DFH09DRAFT_1089036 [Mycena vulgaris]
MRKRTGGERGQYSARGDPANVVPRGDAASCMPAGGWHGRLLVTGAKAYGGFARTTEILRIGARIGWTDTRRGKSPAADSRLSRPRLARASHITLASQNAAQGSALARPKRKRENSLLAHRRIASRGPALHYRRAPLTRRDYTGRRACMMREGGREYGAFAGGRSVAAGAASSVHSGSSEVEGPAGHVAPPCMREVSLCATRRQKLEKDVAETAGSDFVWPSGAGTSGTSPELARTLHFASCGDHLGSFLAGSHFWTSLLLPGLLHSQKTTPGSPGGPRTQFLNRRLGSVHGKFMKRDA